MTLLTMRPLSRLTAALIAVIALPVTLATATRPAQAGTLTLDACSQYSDPAAIEIEANDGVVTGASAAVPVWESWQQSGYAPSDRCGASTSDGSLQINPNGSPSEGATAHWQTETPAQIQIVSAYVSSNWIYVDPYLRSDGYSAQFFWDGGSQSITPGGNCCGGMDYATEGLDRSLGQSRWFGFGVKCAKSSCSLAPTQIVDVRGIQLVGEDITKPSITPLGTNILYANGHWIRGSGWSASFEASADDGICDMGEVIDGAWIQGPSAIPNHGSWTQCPTPVSQFNTIDTSQYGNGALSVFYTASDAANPGNASSPGVTVYVDNTQPSLRLTGPADAPATSGTQYVSATATAGPSGVAGIYCAVDGSSYVEYHGAAARVPVAGVGNHQISCYATNNAIDASGAPASSPTESFNLDIQEPTEAAISFSKIVDAERCRRTHRTIRIPGQWVIEHVHGRPIRVHVRAHRRRIAVVHCHDRVVVRRVKVGGHYRRERFVVPPHTVPATTRRVSFGRGTTVHGWLGTRQGEALAGQRVEILTTPDNGSNDFTPAASAVTASNGTWNAKLGPGASRLVEVSYAGTSQLAATTSAPVQLLVPAAVTVGVMPRHAHWGSTIQISGDLRGGYIPAAGELVVLRIGWRGGSAEIGHVYARSNGSFGVRYTFLRGRGRLRYRIWAASAKESDYPYTPARSRPVWVTVS
jgi:hypothetical protein